MISGPTNTESQSVLKEPSKPSVLKACNIYGTCDRQALCIQSELILAVGHRLMERYLIA